MADLRIENPKTTEAFTARLAALGFPLPWSVDDMDELVAADGTCVAIIDPEDLSAVVTPGELSLAWLILIAVNTCGGFKAEIGP